MAMRFGERDVEPSFPWLNSKTVCYSIPTQLRSDGILMSSSCNVTLDSFTVRGTAVVAMNRVGCADDPI